MGDSGKRCGECDKPIDEGKLCVNCQPTYFKPIVGYSPSQWKEMQKQSESFQKELNIKLSDSLRNECNLPPRMTDLVRSECNLPSRMSDAMRNECNLPPIKKIKY